MSEEKRVYDLTYNGDLYRIVADATSLRIRVYERGLNKGYELDKKDAPRAIREFIKENVE